MQQRPQGGSNADPEIVKKLSPNVIDGVIAYYASLNTYRFLPSITADYVKKLAAEPFKELLGQSMDY